MADRWYRNAVLYCLDVETFQDSDGDGVGDLRGLIARLDYLARLGVTCLWLNPVHPSPRRDDGYDVTDFYGVHPRIGTLGDFADLVHQAGNRGLRVMIDLVVNHTSDEHPWFRSARSSRDSPYRDWYIWSDTEPADRRQGMVFPGEQKETWTWDEQAGAWYYHRFYDFEPDLNSGNPAVQAEIERRLLAGARRRRVPHGRRAVRDRADRAGQPGQPAGLRLPDPTAGADLVAARRRGGAGRGERAR
jgi:maltose alpha-D-glucosyltransferase/alpha-amylase